MVTGTVLPAIAGSQPWGDNGQGTLREFTPSGWVTRGSINYLSGAVTLTLWSAGATNSITRASCVTTVGENISSEYVFRTGAATLRPGSLSIQFARAVGGTQTVTAGIDGTISASGVSGNVDYDTGLVRVRFGTVVRAPGNETEPWFDAENVRPDGKIFRPEPVAASSLRYSAVAYSYLPLDAALLGIDPVRLPSDGRVPIFRPGGFAVVGHTGRIIASVSNGQTIDCARVRLSRVRVVGHNGVVIHTGYVTDLEAGIGENVGVIATGNTSTDCAPNNAATGVPCFFLPALGWGNGWATGNVLRFNTIGSQFPVWVLHVADSRGCPDPATHAHGQSYR